MKLKIFTFPFSAKGGFDDEALQKFLADKAVIEHHHHFFTHEGRPYLTIIVAYRSIDVHLQQRSTLKSDPRKALDEIEKQAYDALRAWRKARAMQEGIPSYMIAHNRQLARMVRMKAASKTDLAKVQGFGDAKVEKYGQEILETIQQHLRTKPLEPPAKDEKAPS